MSDVTYTGRTVDLTPTWSGILPGLLAIIANGETVEARQTAESELRNMARLADLYVESQRVVVDEDDNDAEAIYSQGVEDGRAGVPKRRDSAQYDQGYEEGQNEEGKRQADIINMDPELQDAFEELDRLVAVEQAYGGVVTPQLTARIEALRKQLTDAGVGMWA